MQAVLGGFAVAVGLTASILAAPPTPDNPPVADEQKAVAAIEGSYTIVSGERAGKAIPEVEIQGAIVRFGDGKVVGTDKQRKEFFAATYTLDATKKPWKIDMRTVAATKPDARERPKEMKASGLIKKDGDTLTLIYALPGGEDPTVFKTKEKQQMFVLKPYTPERLPSKFQPANRAP